MSATSGGDRRERERAAAAAGAAGGDKVADPPNTTGAGASKSIMGSLEGSSLSWMMTRPLPASNCDTTLKRELGGSRTSASLGTRENLVMTRALPVVSSMLKRVRVPLLPQNCSLCYTWISHVQLLNWNPVISRSLG